MDGTGGGRLVPGLGRRSRRITIRDAGRGPESRIQPGSYVSSRILTAGEIFVIFRPAPHLMIPARAPRVQPDEGV
jgi:hypothetical protein